MPRPARINVKALLIVLLLSCALIAGGYLLHTQRKQAALQAALASGLQAYNTQEYDKAATELGRYLLVDPSSIEILHKYADAQLRRRNQTKETVQRAISALERVLRLQRGEPKAAEKLTQLYLLLNAGAEAERIARGRLTVAPDDEAAQRYLATALVAQQKQDQALEVLRAAIDGHPERVEAAIALASLLLRVNRDEKGCQELLNQTIANNPDAIEARLARARFFYSNHQPDLASQDALAAEKLGSDDPKILLDLGTIFLDLGLDRRAQKQFELTEKTAHDNPFIYLTLGRVALQKGASEKAGTFADRALAIPHSERRLDVLAGATELYVGANRTEDARKCIDELRPSTPNSDTLKYLEAIVLLAETKTGKALTLLEEVVRLNPRHARAHLILGREYARQGQLRKAIVPLRAYVNLDGESATAVELQLAEIHGKLGQWALAVKAAASANRRAPGNLTTMLVYIEMQAREARASGTPLQSTLTKLHEQTQGLVRENPEDVRPKILLARLTGWLGQVDDAVRSLRAIQDDADHAYVATTTLGEVYADAGRHEASIVQYDAALKLADPDQIPSLKIRLASLCAQTENFQRARDLLHEVADHASPAIRSKALLKLAGLLLRENHRDQARELLMKATSKENIGVAPLQMLLAMEMGESDGFDRQKIVDQLRRIEGESGIHWRLWQARLWLKEDRTEKRQAIEALLNECLTIDPDWSEAIFAKGVLYETSGETDRATAAYRRAFASEPPNPIAGRRLLGLSVRSGRWTEVSRILDRLPPDDPTLESYRIALALQQGDLDQTVRLLEQRIARNAKDIASRLQLAALFRQKNNLDGAERILIEAERIAPDSARVLAARVDLCLTRSEFERALGLCDQAIAKNAGPEAYLIRARVHESSGNLDLAERDINHVTQTDTAAEKGYLALGWFHLRHDRYTEALKSWRKGLADAPDSAPLRKAIGSTMLNSPDAQERQAGEKLMDELLSEFPEDATLLMLRADSLREDEPEKAKLLYEKVIRIRPTKPNAFQRLAQIALKHGHRERALDILNRGIGANPRDVNLLLAKHDLLLKNSPNRATVAAREALALQPDNERAAVALARALAKAGNSKKAEDVLKRFLDRPDATQKIGAQLILADLYRQVRQYKYADEWIRRAEKIAPDDATVVRARLLWHRVQNQWNACVRIARARLDSHPEDVATARFSAHLLMGSAEQAHRQVAKELLRRLVKLHPENPDCYAELGSVYYLLGKIPEARSTFEQGLKVDPSHVRMLNDLSWILSESLNDPEAASELARRAVESGTDNASFLDTWGVVQYRLGHLDESRETLKKCLAKPGINVATKLTANFHLARTLAGLGDPEAGRILKMVLGDPDNQKLLSSSDRREAQELLERLRNTAGG